MASYKEKIERLQARVAELEVQLRDVGMCSSPIPAPAAPAPSVSNSKHPSHITRSSDSSLYDEKCVNCGATDLAGGGWGKLAEPCSKDWRKEEQLTTRHTLLKPCCNPPR